ncbi:MAG: hypothetical protein ABJA78_15500 [Ferruginibacter sp.]
MDILSEEQENFCQRLSIFGILISAACLFQHLFFMTEHWVAFVLIAVYILPLLSYIFLMKQSHYAAVLLIISAGLVFLLELLMSFAGIFSLVLLISLIYLIVSVVLIFSSGFHNVLKRKYLADKAEKAHWADKI